MKQNYRLLSVAAGAVSVLATAAASGKVDFWYTPVRSADEPTVSVLRVTGENATVILPRDSVEFDSSTGSASVWTVRDETVGKTPVVVQTWRGDLVKVTGLADKSIVVVDQLDLNVGQVVRLSFINPEAGSSGIVR